LHLGFHCSGKNEGTNFSKKRGIYIKERGLLRKFGGTYPTYHLQFRKEMA